MCQTPQAVGDVVGDLADIGQTHSQFQGAPRALSTTEPFLPIHYYIYTTANLQSFQEASGIPEWDVVMQEYGLLIRSHTWNLVSIHPGRKLVRCKWIYQTKFAADDIVNKNKAQLVTKGLSEVPIIDYNETFAPVAKMDSIRLVLAIAAAQGWEVP